MNAQDFRGGRGQQPAGQAGQSSHSGAGQHSAPRHDGRRHDGRGPRHGGPGRGFGGGHGGGRGPGGHGRGPGGGGRGPGGRGGGRGGRDRFRRGGKGGGPRFRMEIPEEQEELKVPPIAPNTLRLYSLGGLEDVGERNMQVLEYGDDIITIDCGLWFAEPDLMPGIDYVVPNSKHLQANATKIRGMVMCHGHMDHIGGISHVAPLLGFPPIYCTGLTKAFIERRQEEFGNLSRFKINEFKPRDVLQLGVFRIEPFHINHNIPEAVGIAIHTPVGTIVHTGDFKFDLSPTMGAPADVAHIAQIGERGVLAMMADSTDAGYPGHQISETDVEKNLDGLVKNVEGRLIAVTFASLLMRIQMLINLAEKYGRKVVLEGRSMKVNVEIAHQRKLLRVKPGTIIDERRINDVPDSKLLIIGTGAQAEEFAMLMRVVNKEHARIRIKPGDTVLFSSSVIPGHERNVDALKDTLHRQGAEVVHYDMMDVHAGGHGKNEDLKLMMRLVKPKFLIPIHANFYRRQKHAELGTVAGVPRQNSYLIENGQVMEFDRNGNAKVATYKIPSGNVMVDGLGEGDVSQVVLRDRKEIAAEGMLVVLLATDHNGALVREPEIISKGFVSLEHRPELGKEIIARVKELTAAPSQQVESNTDYLQTKVRNDLAEFIWGKTERRPMILPITVRA